MTDYGCTETEVQHRQKYNRDRSRAKTEQQATETEVQHRLNYNRDRSTTETEVHPRPSLTDLCWRQVAHGSDEFRRDGRHGGDQLVPGEVVLEEGGQRAKHGDKVLTGKFRFSASVNPCGVNPLSQFPSGPSSPTLDTSRATAWDRGLCSTFRDDDGKE